MTPRTEFYCDICNAPMVLEKKLNTYRTHEGKRRRRRFKCTICDFQKVIYASGEMDEKFIPESGIEIVRKMFEQEEENRNS